MGNINNRHERDRTIGKVNAEKVNAGKVNAEKVNAGKVNAEKFGKKVLSVYKKPPSKNWMA